MKKAALIVVLAALVGCGHRADNGNTNKTDTLKNLRTDTTTAKDETGSLPQISNSILRCLKNRDLACLSAFVHPGKGLRFSAYAFIDTATDRVFSKPELGALDKNGKKFNWGPEDAGEGNIILSVGNYIDKFVYDVDFINAKEKTLNRSNAHGTMINNMDSVYHGADFTEFYFPGFDPKMEGMDWRALRLVFEKLNGKYYLVGLVHDQWTI